MIQQPKNFHTADNPVGRFMVAVGAVIEHAKTGKVLIVQRAADQDWQPAEWEIIKVDGIRRDIEKYIQRKV